LIFQLEPFHSPASGTCLPPDPLPPDCVSPTARHLVGEMQETAVSSLKVAPAGAGVDWIVQLLPFQRSASGAVPAPDGWSPTAMHSDAFVHDTLSSRLPACGSGTGWAVQPDEVLISDSNCLVVAERVPTAMQLFGEAHETAVNCQLSVLLKFTVVCWSQLADAAAGATTRRPEASTAAVRADRPNRRLGIAINSSDDQRAGSCLKWTRRSYHDRPALPKPRAAGTQTTAKLSAK
jgi:hypothetical protein